MLDAATDLEEIASLLKAIGLTRQVAGGDVVARLLERALAGGTLSLPDSTFSVALDAYENATGLRAFGGNGPVRDRARAAVDDWKKRKPKGTK